MLINEDKEVEAYWRAKNYELHSKVDRLEEKMADLEADQQKLLGKIEDNERFKLQARGAGWLLLTAMTIAAAAATIGRAFEDWFE